MMNKSALVLLRLARNKTMYFQYSDWFIVLANGIAPQLKTKVKFSATAGVLRFGDSSSLSRLSHKKERLALKLPRIMQFLRFFNEKPCQSK